MKYLLDTHIALWWWMDDPALPAECGQMLEQEMEVGETVALSAISLWEIAMLADRGRIRVSASIDALIDDIEHHAAIRVVPLSGRVAVESLRLPAPFPRDPADRLIGATARVAGLRLMTLDQRIRQSGLVPLA